MNVNVSGLATLIVRALTWGYLSDITKPIIQGTTTIRILSIRSLNGISISASFIKIEPSVYNQNGNIT